MSGEHQSLLGRDSIGGGLQSSRADGEVRGSKWCQGQGCSVLPYQLTLFALGFAFTTLSSSLNDVADGIDASSTGLGGFCLFIAFGVWIGSALSSLVHSLCYSHVALLCECSSLAAIFLLLPETSTRSVLFFYGSVVGICWVLIADGCVRRLRSCTGGSSTCGFHMSFSMGAVIALGIVSVKSIPLSTECAVVALLLAIAGCQFVLVENPEDVCTCEEGESAAPQRKQYYDTERLFSSTPQPAQQPQSAAAQSENYYLELLVGLSLALQSTVPVSLTLLWVVYSDESGLQSQSVAAQQLIVIWVAMAIGAGLSALDRSLQSAQRTPLKVSLLVLVSCAACLLWLFWDSAAAAMWAVMAILGLALGAAISLTIRLSSESGTFDEVSSGLLWMCTVGGGFFMASITIVFWNRNEDPLTLLYVIFASLLLSIPPLWMTLSLASSAGSPA